ncbi:ABC transporter ATP-binding protein, partial [Actinomyces sp. 565]|uniref:ABC transporter ATP-binding protein n=1 Tax=Actinomyces sp. 565 TaxID=2057794 RepID=UPI0013A6ABC9
MSIEATEVTRFFGSAPAVQRLSLSVPGGAVTGLVGPNGAGKTTLLLMLAALLRPDAGTIRVAGLDPVAQPREVHRAVGWMPDAFGTWDSLTCTEILLSFAAAQGIDDATAGERAADMLALVHLEDMARTPARVLSRGQKQRLGLARSLLHAPQVLLLDEPAAGMDPRSRMDLRVILRELASQGMTVLVSSHVLGELEEMVDGVVFMSRGRALTPPGAEMNTDTDTEPGHAQPAGQGQAAAEAPAQADAGEPASAVTPVRPAPLRATWRMRALDGDRLAAWAREQAPPGAGTES